MISPMWRGRLAPVDIQEWQLAMCKMQEGSRNFGEKLTVQAFVRFFCVAFLGSFVMRTSVSDRRFNVRT
jgi:hypothetical protein